MPTRMVFDDPQKEMKALSFWILAMLEIMFGIPSFLAMAGMVFVRMTTKGSGMALVVWMSST